MNNAPADGNGTSLEQLILDWQKSGLFTHCYAATGILSESEPVVEVSCGEDSRDIFDLASLTKALFTTPAILLKANELGVDLDQDMRSQQGRFPARSNRPELIPELWDFSLSSLLRHESGLPAWRNFYVMHESASGTFIKRDPRVAMEAILKEPRGALPCYSDVGFIALGMILERMHQSELIDVYKVFLEMDKGLSTACQQFNFASQWNQNELQKRAIPTGYCPVRQKNLMGEVYDENASAMGGIAPHAGLFGSGRSLSCYLCALHQSSIGRQILDLQAQKLKLNNNSALMGWRQGNDYSAKPFGSGMSMGHLGFTGTAFWLTPPSHPYKPNRYGVLLTNRTINGRLRPEIKEFRSKCFELLWKAT